MPHKKRTTQESKPNKPMALSTQNYRLLAIAFAVIVLGFILMSGGGSDDPTEFSEAIFDFRRLTLGPMTTLGGFIFAIYAIMKRAS